MRKLIVARLANQKVPIVKALDRKPHADSCWCRPADVALAALQREHPLPKTGLVRA